MRALRDTPKRDRQNKATLEGAFVAMGKRKPVKWQGSRVVVCRDVQGS